MLLLKFLQLPAGYQSFLKIFHLCWLLRAGNPETVCTYVLRQVLLFPELKQIFWMRFRNYQNFHNYLAIYNPSYLTKHVIINMFLCKHYRIFLYKSEYLILWICSCYNLCLKLLFPDYWKYVIRIEIFICNFNYVAFSYGIY